MADSISNNIQENQLVNFKLGSEEYGVDIIRVQEIIKVPEITRVPWAPEYVEGVINLRGIILPIIDTRKRFNLEPFEKNETTRIVVASISDMLIGMIVDSVSEVLRIDGKDVDPPPAIITNSDSDYLVGIGKLAQGKRLISLLDLENILKDNLMDEQFAGLARHKSGSFKNENTERKTEEEIQLVSFRLGSEEYAVEIDLVEEIIRIPDIKKVPDVPYFVEGVISLRGKILPVISLRKKFDMEEGARDNRARIIILRFNLGQDEGEENYITFGMIVDFVNEVLTVPVSAIDPPPSILSDGSSCNLKGVGKLEKGERMILLLNVGVLLEQFANNGIKSSGSSDLNIKDIGGSKKKMVNERQLVSFKIGREEFGIDIMNVQEIIRMNDITEIPGSPYFIEGVVNLRGEVLPVLDLRKRFGLEEQDKTDSHRIVVVNQRDVITGIIVDSVSEVIQLQEKDLEAPPQIVSGIEADYIDMIGKRDQGKRFIIILNVGKILNLESNEEIEEVVEPFDDIDYEKDEDYSQKEESIEESIEETTTEMPIVESEKIVEPSAEKAEKSSLKDSNQENKSSKELKPKKKKTKKKAKKVKISE